MRAVEAYVGLRNMGYSPKQAREAMLDIAKAKQPKEWDESSIYLVGDDWLGADYDALERWWENAIEC